MLQKYFSPIFQSIELVIVIMHKYHRVAAKTFYIKSVFKNYPIKDKYKINALIIS